MFSVKDLNRLMLNLLLATSDVELELSRNYFCNHICNITSYFKLSNMKVIIAASNRIELEHTKITSKNVSAVRKFSRTIGHVKFQIYLWHFFCALVSFTLLINFLHLTIKNVPKLQPSFPWIHVFTSCFKEFRWLYRLS